MKMSKLIKTFESFLTKNKKEIKNSEDEINQLIEKLYKKKKDIKQKIKNCDDYKNKDELKDKLKAVKKLIKKAKKEFI